MRIDFEKLIQESGKKMTKLSLAKEMFKAGLFKSQKSAINMINYHQNGKAKSVDLLLLKYLIKRLNKTAQEIINWND